VDDISKNGVLKDYDYDAMNRLTRDADLSNMVFTYDGNGNINSSALNLTYVSNSNRIATSNANLVQYDGMGNILDNGGNVTFSYDAAGRLAVLTRALPGQPVQTVTNQYNGKGERSFTHRVLSPTERYVEYYTYAEDGRLMSFVQSEQLPDDSLGVRTVYNYIWLDSLPVAQFRERYDSTGSHLDSQLVCIHADHLDTPRIGTGYSGTTQSDQTVVWSIWSSSYGYAFQNNNPDEDSETVNLALRFPGQVYCGVGEHRCGLNP
jgi:YD repeat-containing protein